MRQLSKRHRFLFRLLCFAVATFLSGCSTLSLTYRYADWLLYWKIDHYIDITSEQEPLLQNHLFSLQQWHKKEELPRYIYFLHDVKAYWHDGLTKHELESILDDYASLWQRLGMRLVKEGVPILATMNNGQIQNLEQTIREENQELGDEIVGNAEERIQKRVKQTLQRLEDWLGRLTLDQQFSISELIRKFPDTTQVWLHNRLRRQDAFITLLKSQIDQPKFEQMVHDLLVTPEKDAPLAYLSAMQQREAMLITTILTIDQLITPQQREHATEQLQALIQELTSIMKE